MDSNGNDLHKVDQNLLTFFVWLRNRINLIGGSLAAFLGRAVLICTVAYLFIAALGDEVDGTELPWVILFVSWIYWVTGSTLKRLGQEGLSKELKA